MYSSRDIAVFDLSGELLFTIPKVTNKIFVLYFVILFAGLSKSSIINLVLFMRQNPITGFIFVFCFRPLGPFPQISVIASLDLFLLNIDTAHSGKLLIMNFVICYNIS